MLAFWNILADAHLCSFPWLRSPHTVLLTDPQNSQDDKKWCYPAHAWALELGFFKSL